MAKRAGEEGKSHTLTIYLMKNGLVDPKDFLFSEDEILSVNFIVDDNPMTLYYLDSKVSCPRWKSLFKSVPQVNSIEFLSACSTAVLSVTIKNEVFCLTFGQGRHLLMPGTWNERFGLVVTLNSVKEDSLRSIDKKSFAATTRHVREQTVEAVSPGDFGIDVEQDLLRAVVGSPDDEELGARMTGMDAVCVTKKMAIEDVPKLLNLLLNKFHDESYKAKYPWVDRISEINDFTMIESLDKNLVEKIKDGSIGPDKLWLAVPEIVEWGKIAGFRFVGGARGVQNVDLHMRELLAAIGSIDNVSIVVLKHVRAIAIEVNTGREYESWTAYNCICFECETDFGMFLLSGGKWYKVASSFAEEVNRVCNEIPLCNLELQEYMHKDEKSYNQDTADKSKGSLVCLDVKLKKSTGEGPGIEYCDLMSDDGKLIHVKRYAGSKGLSQLFAQGLVSGEAFYLDSLFRFNVHTALPESHRIFNPNEKPHAESFEIVFGIVTFKRSVPLLPFFSRVNLRQVVRRLRGFGYNVSILPIINRLETPGKRKNKSSSVTSEVG